MVYTVALTGGIGSGKSTVADAFSRSGVAVVDADIIARQVVEPGKPALRAIIERFGSDVLTNDGSLNRRRLRDIIFAEPAQKAWLNALLHPLIQQQTWECIAHAASPYVLWVVPLLVENKLCDKANRVLVIDVSPETQLSRTMKRDGISREQAEQIIAAQASREERLAAADDIINNDSEPQTAIAQVANLHQRYLALAAQTAAQEKD